MMKETTFQYNDVYEVFAFSPILPTLPRSPFNVILLFLPPLSVNRESGKQTTTSGMLYQLASRANSYKSEELLDAI